MLTPDIPPARNSQAFRNRNHHVPEEDPWHAEGQSSFLERFGTKEMTGLGRHVHVSEEALHGGGQQMSHNDPKMYLHSFSSSAIHDPSTAGYLAPSPTLKASNSPPRNPEMEPNLARLFHQHQREVAESPPKYSSGGFTIQPLPPAPSNRYHENETNALPPSSFRPSPVYPPPQQQPFRALDRPAPPPLSPGNFGGGLDSFGSRGGVPIQATYDAALNPNAVGSFSYSSLQQHNPFRNSSSSQLQQLPPLNNYSQQQPQFYYPSTNNNNNMGMQQGGGKALASLQDPLATAEKMELQQELRRLKRELETQQQQYGGGKGTPSPSSFEVGTSVVQNKFTNFGGHHHNSSQLQSILRPAELQQSPVSRSPLPPPIKKKNPADIKNVSFQDYSFDADDEWGGPLPAPRGKGGERKNANLLNYPQQLHSHQQINFSGGSAPTAKANIRKVRNAVQQEYYQGGGDYGSGGAPTDGYPVCMDCYSNYIASTRNQVNQNRGTQQPQKPRYHLPPMMYASEDAAYDEEDDEDVMRVMKKQQHVGLSYPTGGPVFARKKVDDKRRMGDPAEVIAKQRRMLREQKQERQLQHPRPNRWWRLMAAGGGSRGGEGVEQQARENIVGTYHMFDKLVSGETPPPKDHRMKPIAKLNQPRWK